MEYDVFISHSSKDKEFVLKLATDLTENGLEVWIDEWNSNLGESITDTISKAIGESRYTFIIMSPDYFKSSWTTQEWSMAMYNEMTSNLITTIPIYYKTCDIPPLLQTKKWVDFRDDEKYNHQFENLIRQIFSLKENYMQNIASNKNIIGSTIVSIDSEKLDEMTKMIKDAVDVFKSDSSSHKKSQVLIDEKLCFIVMPFGDEQLDIVYEDFVKPSIENFCQLVCERGDDVFGSNVIMDDVVRSIEKAKLVVADLTGRNPNVFYEVGIAHTLDKMVLLLAQNIDDVPFDLRHRRVLIYEYSPRGCKKLENEISKNINLLLSK